MAPYLRARSASRELPEPDGARFSKLRSLLLLERKSLRPGLLEHAFDRLPLHAVATCLGFRQRFDRAAYRLLNDGGGAISPRQAAAYFGARLFLDVDPRSLSHRLDEQFFDGHQRHWIGENFLDAGDWRHILQPLEDSPAHREIVEICGTRQNFRDGPRYVKYASLIRHGRKPRRNGKHLDTIDKLDAYFQYYLDLIENIERTGILPRHRFRRLRDTGHRHRSTRSIWHDLVEREIGVAIGADGRLVRHTSGKHRVAAAIGLGIERIPVEIRLVHVHWLQGEMQRLRLPPAAALAGALEEHRFLLDLSI